MKQIGLIDSNRWKLTERSLVPVERDDIAMDSLVNPIPPGIPSMNHARKILHGECHCLWRWLNASIAV